MMNINAQTYSYEYAIEHNADLSRPPGPLKMCVKNTLNTNTSLLVCGADLI